MSDKLYSREQIVCFSGHRPEKLPDGGNENAVSTKVIKSLLYKAITDSINDGYRCFITGAARGIDLWAAEIIMAEKANGQNITLVAAVPYKNHGSNFKGYDKWIYGNLMAKADNIVYVSESYDKQCMKKRNEYMVKKSGRLIAVVGNYRSGTGQTIRLAQSSGIDVHIIDAEQIENAIKEYVPTDIDFV